MSDGRLTYAQQLFLQRITNLRILKDTDAKALFTEIQNYCADAASTQSQLDTRCDKSLDRCIGAINGVIVPALQLEIAAIVMRENGTNVRYYGLVNKLVDDAAKLFASPSLNVHEVALFRLVLEKFVEKGLEMDEIDFVGCPGVLSATDIINLRSNLTGAHSGKLSAVQAERALETMRIEQWIVNSGRHDYELGPR